MNKLSLFSGIGGLDLAAEWAGIKTVGFVEWNDFCQQVLQKRWPGIPIISDIREVTTQRLKDEGITNIELISGGFPCQPLVALENSPWRKQPTKDWLTKDEI